MAHNLWVKVNIIGRKQKSNLWRLAKNFFKNLFRAYCTEFWKIIEKSRPGKFIFDLNWSLLEA